jgi:transporter family-2 protein
MESAFIPLSLAAGSLLAVQAGANAQLSKALGSPFAATTVQLAVGALLVFLFSGLTGSLHALSALPSVTWWHAMGGTASAFYVVSTITLFMRVGAVVTVGLSIAGQILASLALDASGGLGVPQAAIQASTVIGTTLVLAGATAIVLGQSTGQAATTLVARLPWIALGLAAGAVLPIQGAVNGLLHIELQAPLAVATTSFVVATLAMAAVLPLTAVLGKASRPSLSHLGTMPWWGWLGGIAGVVYVTTVFMAMPVIGAAAVVGFTVAGQQVASVLVDWYGLLRLPKRPVTRLRLAGVTTLMLGVFTIKFPG